LPGLAFNGEPDAARRMGLGDGRPNMWEAPASSLAAEQLAPVGRQSGLMSHSKVAGQAKVIARVKARGDRQLLGDKAGMTGMCLRSRDQIHAARAELQQRHLGYEQPLVTRLLARLGIAPKWGLGDWLKSWDVLQTASFLEHNVSRDDPVLDLGAYGSEILLILSRLGFSDLHGIDLDPRLESMASVVRAELEVGDFYNTRYEGARFSAVTAISVIEHGYREPQLLAEVSRLLRPGGYFIASFDYWPEKVDTEGIELFGMGWRIFSSSEVASMLESARRFRMTPVGDLDLRVERTVIDWGGRSYTFGWLALKKDQESSLP
jgi:SAM-dependent methyltransferase